MQRDQHFITNLNQNSSAFKCSIVVKFSYTAQSLYTRYTMKHVTYILYAFRYVEMNDISVSLRELPALIFRNWVHFKQIYV